MLPKRKRVTRELFNEIVDKGMIFSTPFFTFRYLYNKNTPQYTFVVPKKIIKKVTDRNKLKRKGFNIIKGTPLLSGSGIFFYKKKGTMQSSSELKDNIIFILEKTKIL